MKRVEEELSGPAHGRGRGAREKRVKRGSRIDEMGELAVAFGSLDALNGLIERLRGD